MSRELRKNFFLVLGSLSFQACADCISDPRPLYFLFNLHKHLLLNTVSLSSSISLVDPSQQNRIYTFNYSGRILFLQKSSYSKLNRPRVSLICNECTVCGTLLVPRRDCGCIFRGFKKDFVAIWGYNETRSQSYLHPWVVWTCSAASACIFLHERDGYFQTFSLSYSHNENQSISAPITTAIKLTDDKRSQISTDERRYHECNEPNHLTETCNSYSNVYAQRIQKENCSPKSTCLFF